MILRSTKDAVLAHG
jgi:hypothetical protein